MTLEEAVLFMDTPVTIQSDDHGLSPTMVRVDTSDVWTDTVEVTANALTDEFRTDERGRPVCPVRVTVEGRIKPHILKDQLNNENINTTFEDTLNYMKTLIGLRPPKVWCAKTIELKLTKGDTFDFVTWDILEKTDDSLRVCVELESESNL